MWMDAIFIAATAIAGAAWLVFLVAPRAAAAGWLSRTHAGPLILAVIYAALVLVNLIRGPTDGHFFSLDGVARLFDDRGVLLAGWIHYLAFDLFVGAHVLRRSLARGAPAPWRVACLGLTLWLGPVGWLAWRVSQRWLPGPSERV